MIAMELAEVTTPPFIFPVVGVVLCAVLVFAFGFKSPVNPPSFIFEDEGKKSSKKQKKAKKLQNGHIGGSELTNGSQTAISPKQASAKQSPSSKQTSEKHEAPKPKKKTPVTPKAAVKLEKATKRDTTKDQDAGEWTTALSRREKKLRGKKDDRQEKNVDDAWPDEPATDIKSSKLVDQVADPSAEAGLGDVKKPMEQRSTKKDRKKKTGAGDQKTHDSAAAVGKPVVTATSVAAAVSTGATEDNDIKQQTEDNEGSEAPISPKKTNEDNVETGKIDGSPDKKNPKKKKKKSLRQPEQTGATLDVTETSMPTDQPSDVVAETVPDTAALLAEAMQESHDIEPLETESESKTQQKEVAASSIDSKPARSPKKKKKTKDREKIESLNSSDLPSKEPSHTEDLTESTVASTLLSQPQQQNSDGAATDRLDVASVEETASTAQAEAASSIPKPSTSPEDQSKVTFDELGDWQEAKPVKKKKKPRREN